MNLHHITIESKSDKSPLVLVHGAGGSHELWPADALKSIDRTVFAVDMPGHGLSPGPGHRDIAAYADAAAAWLDRAKAGDARTDAVVIGGHSMGGAIAQTFALKYPERTRGLVLVGTGPRLPVMPQILEWVGDAEKLPRAAELIAKLGLGRGAPQSLKDRLGQELQKTRPDIIHGDFSACDEFDVSERLGEIKVPALVICGAKDRLVPPDHARFLADNIAQSRLEILPDIGHFPMLEAPVQFAAIMREWLVDIG